MSPEPLLRGLRVVEIGQYVAAPFAATMLADLGAEVVKVERPGGDPYRRDPARFLAWNRGKSTVTIDLKATAGLAEVEQLIEGADVLIENLRPGSLDALGLSMAALRRRTPGLVTCSISGYGSAGPSAGEPGWEPLIHARAGAQQGLFTGKQPIWLPFPMASVAAAFFAALGVGASLLKRESTGRGQHVETSLLESLLYLNAGAIFHRTGRRSRVVVAKRNPILHVYATAAGGSVHINFSGYERWAELCRLLGFDGSAGPDYPDYTDRDCFARLSDREFSRQVFDGFTIRFAERTSDEWEEALLESPAAVAKCNTLVEWLAHEQVRANELLVPHEEEGGRTLSLVGPPLRIAESSEPWLRPRRHGGEVGALAGHRVVDISSFWAGPLAARLLAELGADVVKVEAPGGEGSYQLLPGLPNIYMDANRSKRGITLDLRDEEDRIRLLDLVRASDVVVENAVAGTWERLGLDEKQLRSVNPGLVYARAKGFGLIGPLAARPCFDYVAQAATGMVMVQGGDGAQSPNFTANDYGTGLHLATGIVFALLARARGHAVSTVESSLMMTATVFESEQVAQIAVHGATDDEVGADLLGPAAARRLYAARDGWVVVCAVDEGQVAALGEALGVSPAEVPGLAASIGELSMAEVCGRLSRAGVPVAVSVHPNAVGDDVQIAARSMLIDITHPRSGPFTQVGMPLRLSVDAPAVRGPAPTPSPRRRA